MAFFLYFSAQHSAHRVSQGLSALGYAAPVQPSANRGADWRLLAKKDIIPVEATMLQIRQEMTALASVEGGEYDGWGSAIVL